MFIFIIWFLCSAGIAAWAKKLDRSPILWFIFAAILSPLIAAFLLLMGGAVSKKCPKCAEQIKKDAQVCKHCGHSFTVSNDSTISQVAN
jgi:hypothetical protein